MPRARPRVRHAAIQDAAAIAAIHVRAWQLAYRGLLPDDLLDGLSVAQREAVWRQVLSGEQGSAVVFVAVDEEAMLGFCAVGTPSGDDDADDRVAEIGAIYVDPGAWRTGVGRALMDATFTHLRAEAWRSATLWVLAENQRALDFYASLGFEHDGARKRHEESGRIEVRMRVTLAV